MLCFRSAAQPDSPVPIGLVDGTVQRIQKPKTLRQRPFYTGRKRLHCVNHIVTCDWRGVFTAAYTSFYGSAHDATAYKQTELFTECEKFFSPKETLLGDTGFEGLGIEFIKKQEKEKRSEAERYLNLQRKQNRVVIEASFGYNQFKWKILRQHWRYDLNKIGLVFRLCCQLTNRLYRQYGALRNDDFLIRKEVLEWERRLIERFGADQLDNPDVSEHLQCNDALFESFEAQRALH